MLPSCSPIRSQLLKKELLSVEADNRKKQQSKDLHSNSNLSPLARFLLSRWHGQVSRDLNPSRASKSSNVNDHENYVVQQYRHGWEAEVAHVVEDVKENPDLWTNGIVLCRRLQLMMHNMYRIMFNTRSETVRYVLIFMHLFCDFVLFISLWL